MEPEELAEVSEKTHGKRERTVGLTMAVVAALLASVTLMGHRLHTEETVQQTRAADGWAFFQAKNSRSHMYAADAKLAELTGPQGASVAKEWKRKAEQERADADTIQHENEKLDEETHTIARRATFFDAAEICLEVAIVLCSVALLTGTLLFWRLSFLGTAIGVVVAALGFLR
jgi:beta-lactamase regulating signal transducer with metallopeptidase domain